MYFDPKTNKYPYPEDTGTHYLKVKKDDGVVFDENYPYIDRSKGFRFKQFFARIALVSVAFPVCRIRMGLRVKGRENLKKHREEIRKGVVSCCNHVHMWDYLGIMSAIFPSKPYILAWDKNINGENGKMIRMVGGIPIPMNNYKATGAYVKAIGEMLDEGGWLHIYAEGAMWEYYAPIRPFKRGTAYMSCKFDKPLIPLAYSYREPGWIRKHVFHQIACFTLNIGEPLYPKAELPRKQREEELTMRSHEAVCRLAGIDPEKNPYPPIYNDSKRVDYYTTEYGIGYKGSW
ncbi:MAG: 1-acyl-sn-glycerol-3-phosphate acyltransferase [Lachnospiraceae bacterium]|nr:1-acyl-sn-glycerol-3-phosphate acyltransferase [Lachnospiraceae bacterium]